ncbi:MAG: glycosyltransferase, partial [Cyclobacteriaceae bacterium]
LLLLLTVFILSTTLQCLFYIILTTAWNKKKPTFEAGKTVNESVSIIVAARNEADNLSRLIPLLLAQNYADYEIIIALDRCSDHSDEVVDTFTDSKLKKLDIKVLPEGISGKKHALSQAIRVARNELLVFTDADCQPASPNWLMFVNHAFDTSTEIAIGYSPYRKNPGFLNRLIRYETIITALQYFSFAAANMPYMGVGRNMSYRKSFFIKKGGYGAFSGVTGGDDDLFIGYHATPDNLNSYYKEESSVFSEAETSWKSWFRQKQRHLSVARYYPKKHRLILGLLGSSQIMFWVTFVILALLKTNPAIILSCLLVRYLCYYWFLVSGMHKIGDRFALWWTPLLDIVHTLFLLVMGPVGFFTKKVKWN